MTAQRPAGGRRSSMRARLNDAEATLNAIRRGEVDAVIVSGPRGERALTIEGAAHPYHELLDAMTDGAALLLPDGTVLFSNRRLARLTHRHRAGLEGSKFQELVARESRPALGRLLRRPPVAGAARELSIVTRGNAPVAVRIVISRVSLDAYPLDAGSRGASGKTAVMAIVTDLTDRKTAEADRAGLLTRLIGAEDDERRRIARELHDETGQSLTALLVGLRTIEQECVTAAVRSAARRLRSVAARTLDDVGRLARGLHPSILDDLGLQHAVRRHVTEYAAVHGIRAHLKLGGVGVSRCTPIVQTTIYRIMQETLTNVARHAHAGSVRVELRVRGGAVHFDVQDDGVGFDPTVRYRRPVGLGLHGMRERVALLGGSVEIASRPGRGTTIRVRIPVPVARRRPAIRTSRGRAA